MLFKAVPVVLLAAHAAASVWPLPTKYDSGKGVLFIDRNVKITYQGQGASPPTYPPPPSYPSGPPSYPHNKRDVDAQGGADAIVRNAIEWTYDTLFNKNFVPWAFNPRLSNFEPSPNGAKSVKSITLKSTKSTKKPEDGVDESYTLDMTTDGVVTISAPSSVGLLYGLTSFTQLFYKHSQGPVYTKLAPVHIEDKPKFQWRGVNLDTSRTFKPVDRIKATIDAMAFNKMNRLHWHATDAQSWPLVIPSMPDLANKGAYTADQKYSPEDLKSIYEYGALLGVNVVMEIDMPGHTSSIAFSYPDLITAFNVQPEWTTYCAEPPCGSLKLNEPKVGTFLQKLLDDLFPRIKPYSSYFHLGGDEVNANAYNLDETTRTNDTKVIAAGLQKFMDRNMAQVKQNNFTPLVWEEMLLQWNLTLPKNTIVQTWQSDAAVLQTVQKGYRALVGNYLYWYLDCGFGQWLNFAPTEALYKQFYPWNDYCAPMHNWRVVYGYDPLTGIPENLQHLVLGGETHIWSEQTDIVNMDEKLWPRTSAAAEVLWSGAKDAQGQNRSQIEAAPRLSEMRERLVARGIRASLIQMPFCTQNGTQCNFPG